MRWSVPLPPTAPKEWQLLTTVIECKDLKSMERKNRSTCVGKNGVFVKVHTWGAANGAENRSTIPINGGGAAPRWGAELPDIEDVHTHEMIPDGWSGVDLDQRLAEVPPCVGIEVRFYKKTGDFTLNMRILY